MVASPERNVNGKKIDYASMFTLRSDGRYMARYTDEKGRHCVYDRDPEKLYHKLLSIQTKKEPNFREIADDWETQHREEITERTWKNYEPHFKDIVARHGDKQISDVTALDIINHLTIAKAKGYSATVVNSVRSIYRMIFDYAVANEYAQYNPVTSVRLPKGLKRGKRVAPTDDQIKLICASTDAPFGLFPFFLVCTGLRQSEALALTWKDIDFESREISVTKSLDYTSGANPKLKSPKTDAGYRTVPIVDILYPLLVEEKKKSTSDCLFPSADSNRSGKGGGLMTLRGYEGAWLRYCTAVGLMDEVKPAITAQRILGHSRIEITREIYTDLRAAQNKKSVKKFNTGMKKYMPK